ncbi:MAG: hypothetical protein ACUVXA_09350 [Candidatus Jordarchaeum sp.]|uniref:hypothetical protein n=1 Tax=Candidatus Jordarchaeum sp. TaxID=2823881 RepID=UPI004049B9A5
MNNKPDPNLELSLDLSLDRKDYRIVLKNSLKMIERIEGVHLIFKNNFYFVGLLLDVAREGITQNGQGDIE